MNILVILGHPKKESFCHAISNTVVTALGQLGHQVVLHDLYEEKFDPVLHQHEIPKDAEVCAEIGKHCREIMEADGIVIIHPNWWGQPPAILKGLDRSGHPAGRGLRVSGRRQRGRRAEGPAQGKGRDRLQYVEYRCEAGEEGLRRSAGDALEKLHLRSLRRQERAPQDFSVIVTSTQEMRAKWLDEVKTFTQTAFPALQ